MIILNSDLDNTLIYSYKKDIGENKKCVEIYQGREISFMTNYAYDALFKVREKMKFIPTTTRTKEQYDRINFGGRPPEYALVCNGGILLNNGKIVKNWYNESLELIKGANDELLKSIKLLENDENINFEIRFLNNLFVFTKSEKPLETIQKIKGKLNEKQVDVFNNGIKIYVVPKNLNKGKAIERIRKLLNPKMIISAGDSEFDYPMLLKSDVAFMPKQLHQKYKQKYSHIKVCEQENFSEEILKCIIEKY